MYIEHTEAMHVVDINSGNRSRSAEGQEVNALEVNLASADELARQLRLRDMGGIIVVRERRTTVRKKLFSILYVKSSAFCFRFIEHILRRFPARKHLF